MEPLEATLDDCDAGPAGEEGRLSELHPRDLTSLFSTYPEELKAKITGKANTLKGLKVAGGQAAHDLDLDRMQVVVRIRPSSNSLPAWSKENCIHALSTCSLAIAPPEESQGYKNGDRGQTYTFSRVFAGDTTQDQFFQSTAGPMVRQMLRTKQHMRVLMAYGISAAGKTFTVETLAHHPALSAMAGVKGSKRQPGIIPRSLDLLFKGLEHNDEGLSVCISHCELYNELFYDLLAPENPIGGRPALRLKEDLQGRVFVDGLSQVEVTGAEQALEHLKRSSKQRQKAATALNYTSSRSHSIFTIALCKPNPGQGGPAFHPLAKFSFVDLAGSERAGRTGNMGQRLKESVAINSSLMTLGRCLEALRFNQQFRPAEPRLVPYRESRVTHLFRDVLHGWGQIMLCVNVSPTARDYDETARVLRYAATAAQIGVAARAEAPQRALKALTPNITKKRAQRAAADAKRKLHREGPSAEAEVAPSGGGTDATDEAAREELEDAVLELQAEVARLTQQLLESEERAVLLETEVREEVSNEMANLLRDMEANYRERLAAELKCPRPQPPSQAPSETRSHVAEVPPVDPSEVEGLRMTVEDLQQNLEAMFAERETSELARKAAESELQSWRACVQFLETRLEALDRLPTAPTDALLQSRSTAELGACANDPAEQERAEPHGTALEVWGSVPLSGTAGLCPTTSSRFPGGPHGGASLETGDAAAAGQDSLAGIAGTRPSASQKDAARATQAPPLPITTAEKHVNDPDDDPVLYCLCRQPDDPENPRDYIACEKCEVWYHPECVDLTLEEAEAVEKYVCPICVRKQERKEQRHAAKAAASSSATHKGKVLTLPDKAAEKHVNDPDDDPVLYCLCRQPDDPENPRDCIACEKCEVWYHPECVELTVEEAEALEKFTCPLCVQKQLRKKQRHAAKAAASSSATHKEKAGGPGSGPDYLTLLVNQVEGTAWLKGWASAQPAAKALAAAAAQREAAAVAGRDEALGMLQQAEQELANCIDKLRALAEERDRYIASEVTQVKANAAMQVELLTGQLERARRENLMLQGQLRAACQGLPLPEAAPERKAHSWAPGNTPHSVALAWARRAVAEGTPNATLSRFPAQALELVSTVKGQHRAPASGRKDAQPTPDLHPAGSRSRGCDAATVPGDHVVAPSPMEGDPVGDIDREGSSPYQQPPDQGAPSDQDLRHNSPENTCSTALAICQGSREEGREGAPPDLQGPASREQQHEKHQQGDFPEVRRPGGRSEQQECARQEKQGRDSSEAHCSQGPGPSPGQSVPQHVEQAHADDVPLRDSAEGVEALEGPLRGPSTCTGQATSSDTGAVAGTGGNCSAYGAHVVLLPEGVAGEWHLQGCGGTLPLRGGGPAAVQQARGTLETLPEEKEDASFLPGVVQENSRDMPSVQAGGKTSELVETVAQTKSMTMAVAQLANPVLRRNRRVTRAWKHSHAAEGTAVLEAGPEATLGATSMQSSGKPEGDPKGTGKQRRGSKRKASTRGRAAPPQDAQENCSALANVAAEEAGLRPRKAKRRLLAGTPMSSALREALGRHSPHLDEALCTAATGSRRITRARTLAHPGVK